MSIINSIQINHFDYKEKRGWDKTYWFFDLHGTVLKPNYTYGSIPKEFYPHALETLKMLSQNPEICMIMYTCSHPHEIAEYVKLFAEHGVIFKYINENPEVKTDINGYGCYDKKPYMNVLFEDKAGFDPNTEWGQVYSFMISKNGENI